MRNLELLKCRCLMFDRKGRGPMPVTIAVRANIDKGSRWPRERIYLGAWGQSDFGGLALDVQTARALRDALDRAAREVEEADPRAVGLEATR